MAGMVDNLRRELQTPAKNPSTPPPPGENQAKPVPVELRPAPPKPWEVAREIVTPVLRPLGVGGIVVVFVVAMLFRRKHRHLQPRAARGRSVLDVALGACQDELAAAAAEAPASIPQIAALPARDEADEIVAAVVVHLLRRRGVPARVITLGSPLEETISDLARGQLRAAFVSALPPSAVTAARQTYRRLRSRAGDTKILIGIWLPTADLAELTSRLHPANGDPIVTSLLTATDVLTEQARPATPAPAAAPAAV
jgi:hypothetical protein